MDYEIIEKTVQLTSDELDIVREVLETRQDQSISVGEILTIECLLEKLG